MQLKERHKKRGKEGRKDDKRREDIREYKLLVCKVTSYFSHRMNVVEEKHTFLPPEQILKFSSSKVETST